MNQVGARFSRQPGMLIIHTKDFYSIFIILNNILYKVVYAGFEINVIPVIMTGGSRNLAVTAEFMPVIVTP
jgi:hypothetical protein